MAQRRMFSKVVIDSDAFIDLPTSARLLYFDLAMRADDDGFVNSPKKIMRMTGATDGDIQHLILKQFLIPFESGVVVIKHWKIHNYIAKDRYTATNYIEEKGRLSLTENNEYIECIQDVDSSVYKMETQVRIGKDRVGKVREEKDREEDSKGDLLPSERTKKKRIEDFFEIAEEELEPVVAETFKEFLLDKKERRESLTERSVKMSIKKLKTLASSEIDQVAIIEASITNGWKGLYALKEKQEQKTENEKLMERLMNGEFDD